MVEPEQGRFNNL